MNGELASPGYIDIHTHADRLQDGIYIYNADPTLSDIPFDRHARISLGLHPWSMAKTDPRLALDRVAECAANPGVVAIGECGLDRLIATPMEEQIRWFREHLEIAQAVGKPVIVHCVRAHNELVRVLKASKISVPVIIHGYNNKWAIAEQMLKHGILLSFGASLLSPEAPVREVLARCPPDQFFLETDDGDAAIGDVYEAAALCRQVGQETLRGQISSNFVNRFSNGVAY